MRNYHRFNGTNIGELVNTLLEAKRLKIRKPLSCNLQNGFYYNLFNSEYWAMHIVPHSEEYIIINLLYLSPVLFAMIMLTCCCVFGRDEFVPEPIRQKQQELKKQ